MLATVKLRIRAAQHSGSSFQSRYSETLGLPPCRLALTRPLPDAPSRMSRETGRECNDSVQNKIRVQ